MLANLAVRERHADQGQVGQDEIHGAMMIEHMHEKLLKWADWSSRGGLIIGLWYTRCTFSIGGRGVVVDPVIDREMSEIDQAVARLPTDLRIAVGTYYIGTGTVRDKAQDCGCCVQTMYQRLHHAQQRIAGMLDEIRTVRGNWPARTTFAKNS